MSIRTKLIDRINNECNLDFKISYECKLIRKNLTWAQACIGMFKWYFLLENNGGIIIGSTENMKDIINFNKLSVHVNYGGDLEIIEF